MQRKEDIFCCDNCQSEKGKAQEEAMRMMMMTRGAEERRGELALLKTSSGYTTHTDCMSSDTSNKHDLSDRRRRRWGCGRHEWRKRGSQTEKERHPGNGFSPSHYPGLCQWRVITTTAAFAAVAACPNGSFINFSTFTCRQTTTRSRQTTKTSQTKPCNKTLLKSAGQWTVCWMVRHQHTKHAGNARA